MSYQFYPQWASGYIYNYGEIVYGSDSNLYSSLVSHRAAAANKPVTGVSYETYWAASVPKVPRTRRVNGPLEMPKMVSNDGKVSKPISYKTQMKYGGVKGNVS